jgi:hypothetical protein
MTTSKAQGAAFPTRVAEKSDLAADPAVTDAQMLRLAKDKSPTVHSEVIRHTLPDQHPMTVTYLRENGDWSLLLSMWAARRSADTGRRNPLVDRPCVDEGLPDADRRTAVYHCANPDLLDELLDDPVVRLKVLSNKHQYPATQVRAAKQIAALPSDDDSAGAQAEQLDRSLPRRPHWEIGRDDPVESTRREVHQILSNAVHAAARAAVAQFTGYPDLLDRLARDTDPTVADNALANRATTGETLDWAADHAHLVMRAAQGTNLLPSTHRRLVVAAVQADPCDWKLLRALLTKSRDSVDPDTLDWFVREVPFTVDDLNRAVSQYRNYAAGWSSSPLQRVRMAADSSPAGAALMAVAERADISVDTVRFLAKDHLLARFLCPRLARRADCPADLLVDLIDDYGSQYLDAAGAIAGREDLPSRYILDAALLVSEDESKTRTIAAANTALSDEHLAVLVGQSHGNDLSAVRRGASKRVRSLPSPVPGDPGLLSRWLAAVSACSDSEAARHLDRLGTHLRVASGFTGEQWSKALVLGDDEHAALMITATKAAIEGKPGLITELTPVMRDVIDVIATHLGSGVRARTALRPMAFVADRFGTDSDPVVRAAAAANQAASEELLAVLAADSDRIVRLAVAKLDHISVDLRAQLAEDSDPEVVRVVTKRMLNALM